MAARNPDTSEVVTELETEDTTAVVGGLSPGTVYRFEVATIGEDGDRRSSTRVTSREETSKLSKKNKQMVIILAVLRRRRVTSGRAHLRS